MVNVLRIQNSNRTIGRSQGYIGLPIRDQLVYDPVAGREVPFMHTAWELTPDEIKQVIDGAPIVVRLFGTAHPPIMLFAGDPG